MRISDWSSDVCSSDLPDIAVCPSFVFDHERLPECLAERLGNGPCNAVGRATGGEDDADGNGLVGPLLGKAGARQIGRASCRERVCQEVENSAVADKLHKKRSSVSNRNRLYKKD